MEGKQVKIVYLMKLLPESEKVRNSSVFHGGLCVWGLVSNDTLTSAHPNPHNLGHKRYCQEAPTI